MKEELLRELDALNKEVSAVLAKRKAWMDEHMKDFAKVQIGEEIYDLSSGKRLGVVTKHYRYWDEQRNPLYDTGMDVCCEYHTGNNIYDNTSRHVGISFGNKKAMDFEHTSRSRTYESIFRMESSK